MAIAYSNEYPTYSIDAFLERIAISLDLPFEDLAEAERQYGLIGQWLSDQASIADWVIYVQGSMRLGTLVRPLADELGFDLDLVCRVEIARTSTKQDELKARVGEALEEYLEANQETKGAPYECVPSRRAWALHYPGDLFHMDVLPAIPDVDDLPTGILLTDKQLREWQPSNPIAYADWFRGQTEAQFIQRRGALAASLRKSVEEIPDWQVRTTLQRAIQILKRHRDIYFAEDPDDRPPSILITTLAALSYHGNDTLSDAILDIVREMPEHIERDDAGRWLVCSPVSEENFADKWNDYPQREKKFRRWLDQVTQDLELAAGTRGIPGVAGRLAASFGQEPVVKAARAMGVETRQLQQAGLLGVSGAAAAISTAPTAQRIPRHRFYGGRRP